MTNWSPKALAVKLLAIVDRDEEALQRLDDYGNGNHDDPYMPDDADAEYRLLARRCITNLMPTVEGTPAQTLYVDGFNPGGDVEREKDAFGRELTPEWDHFQRSRMDSRQSAVYRGAFRFGHSFVHTYIPEGKDKSISRGISAKRSAALFEDPANDLAPYAFLEILDYPSTVDGETVPGRARMWDDENEYEVSFESLTDEKSVKVSEGTAHNAGECPVTRFACAVDLEGRTVGLVGPMIPLNDRLNQTVFDLLVAQTYGSFKVRTITGMAPPLRMKPITEKVMVDGVLVEQPTGEYEPELDKDGKPIPEDIRLSAKRWMFAEDTEARFDTLDETPLSGYIESIELAFRQFTALSQTPPHFMLGQIANLSAEALEAAETALNRKAEEFRKGFGESWERVFRIAAVLDGNIAAGEEFKGEVHWRDMGSRSLAQTADALQKLRDLGAPVKGLLEDLPGMTKTKLNRWLDYMDAEPDAQLSESVSRATRPGARTGLTRASAIPTPEQ